VLGYDCSHDKSTGIDPGANRAGRRLLPQRVKSGRCGGNVLDFMLESKHHPVGLPFT
jgi:hypothetical protein